MYQYIRVYRFLIYTTNDEFKIYFEERPLSAHKNLSPWKISSPWNTPWNFVFKKSTKNTNIFLNPQSLYNAAPLLRKCTAEKKSKFNTDHNPRTFFRNNIYVPGVQ